MPGFPVLHYLLEFAQTHVHWVDDAIQLSHSLSYPSPSACNLSQHEGLTDSLHQVAKILKLQLQHQSFQRIFRVDFLQDWLVWSPCCQRDSQESSPTPQFKSISSSAISLLYGTTLISVHDYWKNHSFTTHTFVNKVMSLPFNTLFTFVTAFLPRSKCLLISWPESPSAVILQPKKIKSLTVSIVSPLFAMKWWGQMPWLNFLNVEF